MVPLIKKNPRPIIYSPIKADPSQTGTIRRRWMRILEGKFKALERLIVDTIGKEDAFGLTTNFDPTQPRDEKGKWSGVSARASGPEAHLWETSSGERKFPVLGPYSMVSSPIRQNEPGEETPFHVRKKGVGGDELYNNLPTERVRINDLKTMQPVVEGPRLSKWDESKAAPIHVMVWKGQGYITQGNHRAAAAWADNVETIQAKVLNLDDPKNWKYLKPEVKKRLMTTNAFGQPRDNHGRWVNAGPHGVQLQLQAQAYGTTLTHDGRYMVFSVPKVQRVGDQVTVTKAGHGDERTEIRIRSEGRSVDKMVHHIEKTEYLGNEVKHTSIGATSDITKARQHLDKHVERAVHEKTDLSKLTKKEVETGQLRKWRERTDLTHGRELEPAYDKFYFKTPSDPNIAKAYGKDAAKRGLYYSGPEYSSGKTLADIPREHRVAVTTNARWTFSSSADQLAKFQAWIMEGMKELFYDLDEDSWWREYIRKGWEQGAHKVYQSWTGKTDFLTSAFDTPISVEKVKVLASRVLTELVNLTTDMATKMSRVLVDGMISGDSPREVARNMVKSIGISKPRALTIARTETVRAHAEGQLDVLEGLGLQQVGVAVEWSTSGMGMTAKGNPSPCAVCAPMAGVVFSLEEARGMIPAHPNCMCSFIPANVGESSKGQIRSWKGISTALKKSLKAKRRKVTKSELAKAGRSISKVRPKGSI